MKTLLWLDDIRNPFQGDWLMCFSPEFDEQRENVVWVKNYNEFVKWVKENGLPYIIAFDHDLGEDLAKLKVKSGVNKKQSRREKKESKTGYDCAKWLVEYCINNNVDLPKWVIQSSNPVGKDNINGLLLNYIKFKNNKL